MTSNRISALASTQDSPSAIAVSSSALPSVVPTTVASAGRTPRVAPVATTSVTIGPGVTTRTRVMSRKAAKSCGFISVLQPPRFVGQHDRDAVADRIGELGRPRDQLLPLGIIAERGARQRADEDFQQLRIGTGGAAIHGFGRNEGLGVGLAHI